MYYANKKLSRVEPIFSSEPTKEKKDLLLGLPIFSIETKLELSENDDSMRYMNYNTDSMLLTDGEKADDPTYTNPRWFHIALAKGRAITFELPCICAVDSFSIGFCRSDVVAVRTPRYVALQVSEDGEAFETVSECSKIRSTRDLTRFEYTASFGAVRARYVRFVVDVLQHIYIDEIELFGCTDVADARIPVCDGHPVFPELDHPPVFVGDYPAIDSLGAENILLSYHCNPNMQSKGLITKEQYLPYVAYLSEDGEVKDTFFDGYLYLPYTAFNFSSEAQCIDGWKYYLDNIFTPDRNLDALDKVTKEVGDKLGIKNHKSAVYFSLLYTFTSKECFGEINGEKLDFENIDDRKKALRWLIDEYLRRYNEGGYEHTRLEAFYWFEEQITYSDSHEEELIAFVRDYVHEKGYKLFWIPYFKAVGYHDWKRLGFDVACMQPNYAFGDDRKVEQIYETAKIAKELGMCVELEITGIKLDENGIVQNPKDVEKFIEYLEIGAKTGYMNTIKMYYQGGVPGDISKAVFSKTPRYREMYDMTYRFAKRKLILEEK
ncbi:MAG: DUF4855 domain-containing protein [Clostridia bacterium]|nr:DUF4855 domain-containing protein [Clostridia bacterium]